MSAENQSGSDSQPNQQHRQLPPQKLVNRSFSAVIVNTKQKGNPVLTNIKNVPWEYGDVVPDFVVGRTTCALFLSLKYHRLHPEYIFTRLNQLTPHAYNLRLLLALVDIQSHEPVLLALSRVTINHNLTLILAFSSAEAARYLETYKSYENAVPTAISKPSETVFGAAAQDFFTSVRGVNKTDSVSLLSNFGSVKRSINATAEEIGLIAGWGGTKVDRWTRTVKEPFIAGKHSV